MAFRLVSPARQNRHSQTYSRDIRMVYSENGDADKWIGWNCCCCCCALRQTQCGNVQCFYFCQKLPLLQSLSLPHTIFHFLFWFTRSVIYRIRYICVCLCICCLCHGAHKSSVDLVIYTIPLHSQPEKSKRKNKTNGHTNNRFD